MVANLLDVKSEYKVAIETSIKGSLQNIVTETSDDAVKVVNFLRNNKAGRASFIPLDKIKPKFISENLIDLISENNGFVDVASNLVEVNPKYIILKKFLLGNIIIATNIKEANEISKRIIGKNTIVTLEGDMVRAGGVISGGSRKKWK